MAVDSSLASSQYPGSPSLAAPPLSSACAEMIPESEFYHYFSGYYVMLNGVMYVKNRNIVLGYI